MDPDVELLERWRGGDSAAGEALFERHFAALWRFFSNKTDRDVEDLIQQSLLRCLESRDAFRGDASFRTYLFTIARHELYAYWRRRRDDVDLSEVSLHAMAPSPSSLVAHKREQRLLLDALQRLPMELQIVVELHYWEGLTGPELATVLEVPEGTVRTRLRRAKEELRAGMVSLSGGELSLDSTDAALDRWAAEVRHDVLGN